MKEETLEIQSALSILVLPRGKEQYIRLYFLWSILEFPIFLCPEIITVLPREPELKASKEQGRV